MLTEFKKVRSIGSFKEFESPNDNSLSFDKFNIIFGDNGNGKTTFTTILDSLNKNQSNLISQKKSLNSTDSPYSIIKFQNNQNYIFDGNWKLQRNELTTDLNKFIIFNEEFVKKNFFDISFEKEHKRNLHKIIFGERGIEINNQIEENQNKISELKRKIGLNCKDEILEIYNSDKTDLENFKQDHKNISENISEKQSINEIKKQPELKNLSLINLDVDKLISELGKDIDSESHNSAKIKVNEFRDLNFINPSDYENFIKIGSNNIRNNICPFCQREFDSDEIIELYKKYFNQEFETYKSNLSTLITNFNNYNLTLTKERQNQIISDNNNSLRYWNDKGLIFEELFEIDFEKILLLKNETEKELKLKKENISNIFNLEKIKNLKRIIEEINLEIRKYNEICEKNNEIINGYKTKLDNTNIQDLKDKEIKLKNILDRFDSKKEFYENFKLCIDKITELKTEMKTYIEEMSEEYLNTINDKLKKLGLKNLKLNKVDSVKVGTSKVMSVEIRLELDNANIDMNSNSDEKPAFNNTLSNGEKNALAFAFFLSKLEKMNLENKILVFDDPLTSLDDNRKRNVCLEIKYLRDKALQTIVLTHKNSFFKILYNETKDNAKTFELKKDNSNGSKLKKLDMVEHLKEDCEKRLEKLNKYLDEEFDYPELENDIRKVLERVISTKHYLERKKIGKTIVSYCGFNKLFWEKGKLIAEKPRIQSIYKIANDESHDDICEPIIYEKLTYDEKKDIVKEVFELINKI